MAAACRPNDAAKPSVPPADANKAVVDFPEKLRADDPAVNEVILRAIQACVDDDYDAFRLLWSAREEPITEQEFRRARQAEPNVTIKDLRQVRFPDGQLAYAVRGLVEFSVKDLPDPQRDVVLLLVQEKEQWRIARVPAAARKALRELLTPTADANTSGEPTTQPASPAP